MRIAPNLITPAAELPLRREEVLEHLRADDEQFHLIERLMAAAVGAVEDLTGRALMPQTLELPLDEFPDVITLPRPPLISVTSIVYVDDAGATITLSSSKYQVVAPSGPMAGFGSIIPAYGEAWPSTRGQLEAVRVRYVAGYTDPDTVPSTIRSAMLLIIGDLFEHREAQVQGPQIALVRNPTVDWLLRPYHVALV